MAAVVRGMDRKFWTFGDLEIVSVISRRPEPHLKICPPFSPCSFEDPDPFRHSPTSVTSGVAWADSPLVFWAAALNGNSSSIKSPGAEKNREMMKKHDGAPVSTLVLRAISS